MTSIFNKLTYYCYSSLKKNIAEDVVVPEFELKCHQDVREETTAKEVAEEVAAVKGVVAIATGIIFVIFIFLKQITLRSVPKSLI